MKEMPFPEVYGTVTVGERGQIVVPAKIRKIFKIIPGDKLIAFAKKDGPIAFIPASNFGKFLDLAAEHLEKIKKEL
jgi:AbrB family looped-hinge helix DNA binding protein